MEPLEQSESIGSSIKDPQLSSHIQSLDDDYHDPQPPNLNHITHLDEELQNKLDLKDEDEIEGKSSNFEVRDEHLCDEDASPESDKGQGFHHDDDDGWIGDDEVSDWIENVSEKVDEVENKDERRHEQYPLRPEAEDCSFYLKTGTCKFGFNCKFNHPIRRRNQVSHS